MNEPQSSAPVHLLLVANQEEDFLRFRRYLEETCQKQVQLDRSEGEREALARLQKENFDLLLCDYKSGNGSALRLLQEIHSRRLNLPVIFLSDHAAEGDIHRALRSLGVPRDQAERTSLARQLFVAIRNYCQESQQQKTGDTLRKLWRAVEQTADMIVVCNRSGSIEYVNPAFEAATGYSREEAVGQNVRLLKSSSENSNAYKEMWRTVLTGNTFRGVIANRKKNGENFFAERTITPLRDGDRHITHFVSTDRDVTERRRLEAQLQQAQRMDAIGRLAGGVAHDFNNLLMVISAYAELMLDSIGEQHPLRRNVQEIMAASGRATDLTRQLLAFGRKQMQSLLVLDLNSVVGEISQMLGRLIGEDIELEVVKTPNLGSVKADVVQIEQVLMNLAANARDAMPNGGKLKIETANISLEEAYLQHHPMVPLGDYIQLTVTDTGQGIPPKHMGHIFEPFYTTKGGKGTGLGLATVYGIVRQSGGFIWVYSEPTLGTTFKIYLPRVRQRSDHPRSLAPSRKPPRGWQTLLIAEDETAVRQSEKEFLESLGYTVLEARNGDEALRIVQHYADEIHLIVTDVVMPNMGGAKLAEHLSATRPEIKFLFVSGYAENTALQNGKIDGASQFLQKPFTLKSLAGKINDVLNSAESARAALSTT